MPISNLGEMQRISFALEPARQFRELEDIWRDLETRSDGSFFTSWHWIGTWLALTRGQPLVLVGRWDGRVVALALLQPARIWRHGLGRNALFLNQSGDPAEDAVAIEYNSVLADREIASVAFDQAIAFLQSAGMTGAPFPRWQELHMAGLRHDPGQTGREQGLLVSSRWRKPTWRVELDKLRAQQTPYLHSLSANSRYQIRRSLKMYEERGAITAMAATELTQAHEFYDRMKEWHQRYWRSRGKPGAFGFPFFEEFTRALLNCGLPRKSVEMVRVAAGEIAIGYLLNFVHRGHVYAYLSGFHYEKDAKLKPGLVSHCLCIERHLREETRIYDFMAGDDRYKESLGRRGPALGYFVLQRRTPKAEIENFARRIKQKIMAPRSVQRS